MVAQRQQPIVINAVVGEDRRLIIDLTPDFPIGETIVTITWISDQTAEYPDNDEIPPETTTSE
jgi:hypothetical protein